MLNLDLIRFEKRFRELDVYSNSQKVENLAELSTADRNTTELNLILKNNPRFLAAAFLGARIKVELNSLVGIIVVVVWSLPKVVLKLKTGFYKAKVRAMT